MTSSEVVQEIAHRFVAIGRRDIAAIVSPDRGFDMVAGIRRRDPTEFS